MSCCARFLRKMVVVAGLLGATSTLLAQPQDLAVGKPRAIAPGSHGSVASRFVPNLAALRKGGGEFSLTLPDGQTVILQRVLHEDRGNGDFFWRGKVLQDEGSLVGLTVKHGVMIGRIWTGGATYVVRMGRDGQVIERLKPMSVPFDGPLVGLSSASPPAVSPLQLQGISPLSGNAPLDADSQIDVMVLYTPAVQAAAGGTAAVDAEIQANVDLANLVFENSGVPASYRLVHAALAPINFQGDPVADSRLTAFASDAGVAALRNAYGADLVALYANDLIGLSGLCGVALNNTIFDPNGGAAWQIFDRLSCGPVSLVYAHENGHLLGMAHQPGSSEFPFYPFAHAHSVAGVFTTVMYSSIESTIIPYFSNPDILYQGFPIGIADERDNARVAVLNAPIAAALRPAANFVTSPPEAPTSLFTLSFNAGEIYMSWMDHSSGPSEEQNFEVERSSDGTNFTRIATTPTNQSFYHDGGLAPGATYWYRVRAVNFIAPFDQAGVSDYSNVAQGTVGTPPQAPSGLQAVGVSPTAVRLTWTDQSSDEAAFVIEFFVDGSFEGYDETPADATSYITPPFFGLLPLTSYSFRVYAYNDFGESSRTGPVQATTLAAGSPDADSDGIADSQDNCRLAANGSGAGAQCDSDGDGFGNRCDGDFLSPAPGNGSTNAQDYAFFRSHLGAATSASGPFDVADLNCNGVVNAQDYAFFRTLLGTAPGPGAGP